MDPIEAQNRKFLQQLVESGGVNPDLQVQPGDEAKLAPTIGNYFLNMVGAPKEWQSSVAEDKIAMQNLPRNLAMGTMGTVGNASNTGKLLQGSYKDILQKYLSGQTLSAADQLAVKALVGGQGTAHVVDPIAQNTAGRVAFKGFADGGDVEPITSPQSQLAAPQVPQLQSAVAPSSPALVTMIQNFADTAPAENYQLPEPQIQPQVMPQADALGQSYANQVQGINKQAKAESALGEAEGTAAGVRAKNMQKAADLLDVAHNQNLAHLEEQRDAIQKDIQEGHIDPNRYMNSLSAAGKVRSAIGIFLSGLGQGLRGGQGNPALDYFQKQIEHDIEAQKANLSKKQNMLSALDKQFGNIMDSSNAMRVIYADMYAADIAKAAAASKDPMAKGRAQQLIGQLQAQYAPLMQQMAIRQTITQGGKAGLVPVPNQINALVPESHKAKAFDEYSKYQAAMTAATDIGKVMQELGNLQSTSSRLGSPIQSGKKIDALNFQLLTVAKPLMGALSEKEREEVAKSLEIGYLDDAATIKRKTQNVMDLARRVAPNMDWLSAYGVNVPKPSSTNVNQLQKPANYGR